MEKFIVWNTIKEFIKRGRGRKWMAVVVDDGSLRFANGGHRKTVVNKVGRYGRLLENSY